jgi:hypothetical protein
MAAKSRLGRRWPRPSPAESRFPPLARGVTLARVPVRWRITGAVVAENVPNHHASPQVAKEPLADAGVCSVPSPDVGGSAVGTRWSSTWAARGGPTTTSMSEFSGRMSPGWHECSGVGTSRSPPPASCLSGMDRCRCLRRAKTTCGAGRERNNHGASMSRWGTETTNAGSFDVIRPSEFLGKRQSRTEQGVPYLAPEFQLLYKSTDCRPKDDRDAEVVPSLAANRRTRLHDLLREDHPWQALLNE